jgi:hypothetical protein
MMVGIWAWSSGEIPAKSAIGDQVIISRPPRRLLVGCEKAKLRAVSKFGANHMLVNQ